MLFIQFNYYFYAQIKYKKCHGESSNHIYWAWRVDFKYMNRLVIKIIHYKNTFVTHEDDFYALKLTSCNSWRWFLFSQADILYVRPCIQTTQWCALIKFYPSLFPSFIPLFLPFIFLFFLICVFFLYSLRNSIYYIVHTLYNNWALDFRVLRKMLIKCNVFQISVSESTQSA